MVSVQQRTERPKARPCDPITNVADIDRLRDYMEKQGKYGLRNSLIVTIGCNMGLRASDLCKLKVKDVWRKDYLEIVEQKTKKIRRIAINDKVKKSLSEFGNLDKVDGESYLFKSQKGGHINPKYIHKLMKESARELGIEGNIGSHTLRKTMAYHVYRNSENDPEALKNLMVMFNHSSESVTKRYLTSSVTVDYLYKHLNL